MIPVLETDRLRLRGWHSEDFNSFAAYRADGALNAYRGGARSLAQSWDEFCALSGHWVMRGTGSFALEEKSSGRVAGYAGLWHPADLVEPELCWGLYKEFHGMGLATEAARRVQIWASKVLCLPALMSFINPENLASQKVAERLGASLEGEGELRGAPRLIYRHSVPA